MSHQHKLFLPAPVRPPAGGSRLNEISRLPCPSTSPRTRSPAMIHC